MKKGYSVPGKILLCDDDAGIVEAVQLILELKGYEVVSLMEGEDLFATLDSFSPDLILLDLWLSGISGEDITKKLKSKTATKNIPVVILSANTQTCEISSAIGADDYVCKPFDIEELERVIKKYVAD
jgi:DNA-binding response OmpR family regulator